MGFKSWYKVQKRKIAGASGDPDLATKWQRQIEDADTTLQSLAVPEKEFRAFRRFDFKVAAAWFVLLEKAKNDRNCPEFLMDLVFYGARGG